MKSFLGVLSFVLASVALFGFVNLLFAQIQEQSKALLNIAFLIIGGVGSLLAMKKTNQIK